MGRPAPTQEGRVSRKNSGVTMEGGGEESKKADPSNPRGIPPQEFIENVGEYCKALGTNESVISTQQEMYSKYKFMEAQMAQHRNAIAGKKPEIEKSLAMLKKLIEKREKGEDSMKTISNWRIVCTPKQRCQ